MRALTPKERVFADAILDGKGPSEAYRIAYDTKASGKVVSVNGAKVQKRPHVSKYIAEERLRARNRRFLTREKKRGILAEIAEKKTAKNSDKIKAIEVDNRMTGDDAPQKVEVFGLADLMKLVRTGEASDGS